MTGVPRVRRYPRQPIVDELVVGLGYEFVMTSFPDKPIVAVLARINHDTGLCEFVAGRQPGGYTTHKRNVKRCLSPRVMRISSQPLPVSQGEPSHDRN